MFVSIIEYISLIKSANEFEYREKMQKYLWFAYDRLETKCWWLRLNNIENIILNCFYIWILKTSEAGLANNRSINVRFSSSKKNALTLSTW